VGGVNKYLVERYLPGVSHREVDEASAQLASAATELAGQGVEVRYIGSTFIPEEESSFSKLEAADASDVRRVCERAGVRFARIVEAHDLFPNTEEQ